MANRRHLVELLALCALLFPSPIVADDHGSSPGGSGGRPLADEPAPQTPLGDEGGVKPLKGLFDAPDEPSDKSAKADDTKTDEEKKSDDAKYYSMQAYDGSKRADVILVKQPDVEPDKLKGKTISTRHWVSHSSYESHVEEGKGARGN